jgi:hypothetical protein
MLDTGVLLGAFSPRDAHHVDCRDALASIGSQGLVVMPVVVELSMLLRRDGMQPADALRRLARATDIRFVEIRQEEVPSIAAWMEKYRDLEPDFADACIVHVAERERVSVVLTLDSEFLIYRSARGKAFDVLPRGAASKTTRTRP